jgi:predicted metal-dependent HD superfamily phosphohydrolase
VPAAGSWLAAVQRLGGDPDAARNAAADLVRRWAEPHRHYHTTAHLDAVLSDTSRLADALRLDDESRAVITLVACAHDVVYDAHPGDDERASAEWARLQLIACGVAPAVIERVAGLVLATIDHEVDGGDLAGAVLLDADLAVLAADAPDYERYVAGVRAEYAAVPEDGWRHGRARVLSALLGRDPLYMTEPARQWWEARARHNVSEELSGLT